MAGESPLHGVVVDRNAEGGSNIQNRVEKKGVLNKKNVYRCVGAFAIFVTAGAAALSWFNTKSYPEDNCTDLSHKQIVMANNFPVTLARLILREPQYTGAILNDVADQITNETYVVDKNDLKQAIEQSEQPELAKFDTTPMSEESNGGSNVICLPVPGPKVSTFKRNVDGKEVTIKLIKRTVPTDLKKILTDNTGKRVNEVATVISTANNEDTEISDDGKTSTLPSVGLYPIGSNGVLPESNLPGDSPFLESYSGKRTEDSIQRTVEALIELGLIKR